MARERSTPPGSGYGSIVGSGLLLTLSVAVVLLGRTKLKNDEAKLYSEINRLERRIEEFRRANVKLQLDYETLTSPAALNARVRDMDLGLRMPSADARIILAEPVAPAARLASTPIRAPGPAVTPSAAPSAVRSHPGVPAASATPMAHGYVAATRGR